MSPIRSIIFTPRRLRAPLAVGLAAAVATITVGVVATGAAHAESVPAAPLAATPSSTSTTPNTSPYPPTAPTSLTATSVTTGSVALSWTASKPGCCSITGYDIQYIQVPGDVVWRTSVGNVTTATITANIQATSQYRFTVSAKDSLGHYSSSSNSVIVVTPATNTGDTTPPTTPLNLAGSDVTATTIRLTWTPSTDNVGVVGYDIWRADGVGMSSRIASVPASTTTYVAPLSSSIGPYWFLVRARDAAGNVSIASNTLLAPPPSSNSPALSPPPVSTPPPASCDVSYAPQTEWTGGFIARVTITNTQTTAVDGWSLTFKFGGDQRIVSAWGASYSQSGSAVVLKSMPWNASINANSSTSFGLMGTWTTSNAAPSGFALNGVPCTVV